MCLLRNQAWGRAAGFGRVLGSQHSVPSHGLHRTPQAKVWVPALWARTSSSLSPLSSLLSAGISALSTEPEGSPAGRGVTTSVTSDRCQAQRTLLGRGTKTAGRPLRSVDQIVSVAWKLPLAMHAPAWFPVWHRCWVDGGSQGGGPRLLCIQPKSQGSL